MVQLIIRWMKQTGTAQESFQRSKIFGNVHILCDEKFIVRYHIENIHILKTREIGDILLLDR